MSLEELLKNTDSSPVWKIQRHKLIRIVTGILISIVGLLAAAVLVVTLRKPHAAKMAAPATNAQEADSRSLAELMRVRKETADLQRDVHHMRQVAAVPGSAPGHSGHGRGLSASIVNYEPGEGFAALTAAKTELYVPTGAVFQAELLTPIKTSVERTFVMAETTNEYRMDMKRRIPRGSRLIGRSHLDPVLKGVVVEFSTLVLPSGIETGLSGLALSRNALPEVEGLYFSDRVTTYGTALAFGFLSGFADAAREREVTILGSQPTVSIGNQVLSGLSTASFQVANDILRDVRSNAIEYVVVPAGEQVFVVLTRRYDIVQGGAK
jgi:hypothetical protein